MLGKTGYLAVIDHDGHAVFIDAGLLAFLHHFVELWKAPDLPFLAIKAQVLVLYARVRVVGFPLEAQIGVLVVVGGLYAEFHMAVFAFDGHRLQRAGLDQLVAHVFFGVFFVVARHTGIAALGFFVGALVRIAAQPFIRGLTRIEQIDLLRRNLVPVNFGRIRRHRSAHAQQG